MPRPAEPELQPQLVGPGKGCVSAHAPCPAVLQSSVHLAPPPAVTGSPLAVVDDCSPALTSASGGPRAPPDVCLTRLCISRT
jgi:hypothetical protein